MDADHSQGGCGCGYAVFSACDLSLLTALALARTARTLKVPTVLVFFVRQRIQGKCLVHCPYTPIANALRTPPHDELITLVAGPTLAPQGTGRTDGSGK